MDTRSINSMKLCLVQYNYLRNKQYYPAGKTCKKTVVSTTVEGECPHNWPIEVSIQCEHMWSHSRKQTTEVGSI